MTADWLFVVGISCEISGAALVAGEIFFASREENALRGTHFPEGGGPLERDFRGPAYTWTGGVLLVLGFALQLVGYVVSAHDDLFFVVSGLALLMTFIGGRRIAERFVQRLLYRRATATRDEMARQKYRSNT